VIRNFSRRFGVPSWGFRILDYTREDVTAGGARYDVVFDAANVLSFGRTRRRALRPYGVFVTVNPFVGLLSLGWLSRLRRERRIESIQVRPGVADLESLSAWISAGKVKPLIDRSYPPADAAAAHPRSEGRRAQGKNSRRRRKTRRREGVTDPGSGRPTDRIAARASTIHSTNDPPIRRQKEGRQRGFGLAASNR
jgi:Zinc-binding dehydrogenase